MTLSELLDRVESAELLEWMAYARLRNDPHAFDTVDEQLNNVFQRMKQRADIGKPGQPSR